MILRKKILAVCGAALLLGGCSDWNAFWGVQPSSSSGGTKPVATEPDIVSVKLAQAADKASRALDSIANIEQQKNPTTAPISDDYSNAPANMIQPVSLRWSGPIEQVTRVLAERAGLRFRVKGRTPAVPVVVNVDAYQEPIIHVLRDIGLQAGTRATMSIDQNEGAVEIQYPAADQSR